MDNFLQSISQHLISFFNLSLMKRIDTGDRVFDTTVQMLCSTLIGGLISGLIAIYSKGLWQDYYNRTRAIFAKNSYNPLEFDPSLAPEKPSNGVMFTYIYKVTFKSEFYGWFFKYHLNKLYPQKNKAPLRMFTHGNVFTTDNPWGISGQVFNDTKFETHFPIWRHTNGYYVYVISKDEEYSIVSDSGEALKSWQLHYNTYIVNCQKYVEEKEKERKNLSLYEISGVNDICLRGTLSSNKVFDTLFFEQKEYIMDILRKFKNKTLYPKHLPVDTKLGIILHGPPGTGKTGFITALANFLERSVYVVHMNKIRTRKEFDAAINMAKKSTIIVFDEFDCVEYVKKRDSKNQPVMQQQGEKENTNMAYTMMLMAQKEKSENIMAEMKKEREAAEDKLDLAYILYKLDGLECGDERVIVATTNHPEQIDPALLRPGRFGIQLNLKNCTHRMLRDIIGMVFILDEESKAAIDLVSILEYKWSPAEVLQIAVTEGSQEKTVEYLKTHEPC